LVDKCCIHSIARGYKIDKIVVMILQGKEHLITFMEDLKTPIDE